MKCRLLIFVVTFGALLGLGTGLHAEEKSTGQAGRTASSAQQNDQGQMIAYGTFVEGLKNLPEGFRYHINDETKFGVMGKKNIGVGLMMSF